MEEVAPQQRLANEIFRMSLDYIAPDPDKTVPVDCRRFLSVESFGPPPDIEPSAVEHIGNFRLASKRFSEIGAPLLFTRVQARLSKQGLERLETLSKWKHLAQYVKKFSYMVPYFYCTSEHDPQGMQSLLVGLEARFGHLNLDRFRRKIREQQQILSDEYDAKVLKKAVASFTSLQHIQLLRVHDDEDNALLAYLRQHDAAQSAAVLSLEWTRACIHGSRTIGSALLASNAPCSWFSSPQLSPQSATFLLQHTPNSLTMLAGRLTCLTLHFDDGDDLDIKMKELSGLFKDIFTVAKNMKAVHVGFPGHRPLNLPLEEVFHDVTWERLVAFGIQGWKLSADDILNLALRHRDRLKGLRLRDVILREGSLWKDVLGGLRDSMCRLEWVSLRRIGYEADFDNRLQAAGAEVPDDLESESESSEEDYDPFVGPSNSQHYTNFSDEGSRAGDSDFDSAASHSDDEHGGDAYSMDFPPLDSPVTPASATWCNCNARSWADSPEILRDNGVSVSHLDRKAWEKWVIRRCPEHGER